MEVTTKRSYEQLKVYINNSLHLNIKLKDLIGFQSWIHGDKEYYIEYTFVGSVVITTAYGEKEKWQKVLEILDNHT